MQFASTVLFVDDVTSTLAFYQKAFGFEQKFYDPDYDFGELDAGGAKLAIASHRSGKRMMPGGYQRPSHGHPEGVEIAFFTSDVPADYSRAVSAGAEELAVPREMPWGQTVAYVKCPEGTVVGLCSPIEE